VSGWGGGDPADRGKAPYGALSALWGDAVARRRLCRLGFTEIALPTLASSAGVLTLSGACGGCGSYAAWLSIIITNRGVSNRGTGYGGNPDFEGSVPRANSAEEEGRRNNLTPAVKTGIAPPR
jgi:hypothetical protein